MEDDLLKLAKEISEQRDRAIKALIVAQSQARDAQAQADRAIKMLEDHLANCRH